MRCDEARELAPELALGIVDGEERAEALRHLSACADCRRAGLHKLPESSSRHERQDDGENG